MTTLTKSLAVGLAGAVVVLAVGYVVVRRRRAR